MAHGKDCKCGEVEFVFNQSGGEDLWFWISISSKQPLFKVFLTVRIDAFFVIEIGLEVLLCRLENLDFKKSRHYFGLKTNFVRPARPQFNYRDLHIRF